MPNKVVHLNSIGPVIFNRNRRSKSIKISVKPDKSVLVSFPFFVAEQKVLSFLSKNDEWIRRQQFKADKIRKTYKEGSIIKTKLYTIELVGDKIAGIETNGYQIRILNSHFDSEEFLLILENMITKIYRIEARHLLPPKLNELAQKHGFKYNKVTIRNNRRNWGSCSYANNISLNLQMMKLPDELIEYILLHELVHTKIKDHSAKFWEKLNSVTNGQARELSKQVKQFSTYTM